MSRAAHRRMLRFHRLVAGLRSRLWFSLGPALQAHYCARGLDSFHFLYGLRAIAIAHPQLREAMRAGRLRRALMAARRPSGLEHGMRYALQLGGVVLELNANLWIVELERRTLEGVHDEPTD